MLRPYNGDFGGLRPPLSRQNLQFWIYIIYAAQPLIELGA